MNLGRLNSGEKISSVSAILLFALMFFHWFGVKAVNTSNLLFAVQAGGPGKSVWEALDFIPVCLVLTIVITLAVAALRLTTPTRRPSIPLNALVAVLGVASMLMILYRIIDPPVFDVVPTITYEGAAQLPIFLALMAAAGIAFGGGWAMREEGIGTSSRPDQRRG
jgi:hypothetical protein